VTTTEQVLRNVVAWATREANVRRLLLVGSRARTPYPDDLADVDLQVYSVTSALYTEDALWLSEFGEVWLCVRDEYFDGEVRVPTRLIIFNGGVKVDFAFYPAGIVSKAVRSGLAYQTLVDRDPSSLQGVGEAVSVRKVTVPSEADFRSVVEEFWFEAYHVAKYLARNEFWLARSRDWAAKQFLLSMIEWHERFAHGRVLDPDCTGKRASMSEDTWQALRGSFVGFGREENWDALFVTMRLLRQIATETAAALRFTYPADVDRNLAGLIAAVREGADSSG
jgi:aminoglycoside 6-adenylyltransferase